MSKTYSPIRKKLMRIVLVTSGVVLFLTCASLFAYEFLTYRQTAKHDLATIAKIIADNSTGSVAFQNSEDANEVLAALQAEKDIVAACLYDRKGNVFAKYPVTISPTLIPKHPKAEGFLFAGGALEGFQPVVQGNSRVGTLWIQSDMKTLYRRLTRYFVIMILAISVSSLMAYLLSQRLQKTILDPIHALADTASTISHQRDYTVRAKKFDEDEIGMLTDAFNQMLTQIEAQNAEITSFSQGLEKKVDERTNQLGIANNELKLKTQFVETIIDSSVDVIAVFDSNFNYVLLNKYGREIYGVKDDIIGKNIVEVFPKVKDAPMYYDLQRALTGERIHDPQYQSRISDRILENFYIPLLDKDNGVYSVLVIGHDITDTVKANEKLLLLNKELEKSNRDLEQFAFVASHDLQEPLRKIQTFSHLIESKLDDKEAIHKYISKVISSAVRMTDLIKSVLNYSRLSNEDEEFEPVDLNIVIENIKSDYEITIAEKEAVIETSKLPVVNGNQLQLNQLFLNLISNSLKFSETQPVISITSHVVEKDQLTSGNGLDGKYAELTIKDNGIGFEQLYADKVFAVFQRLHNKQQYPGTGIGLALCKKIVDNHRGFISVNSELGKGTTFTIYLPVDGEAV